MYFLDLILLLGVIITIVSTVLLRIFLKENKYIILLYCFPIVLSLIHFAIGKFNYLAVPLYIASIVVIIAYTARKTKYTFILFCFLSIMLSLLPIGTTVKYNLKNYASMSYSGAFKNLNQEFKNNYPFTDWKRVDYEKKYNEYIERFNNADKNKDKEEYYLALKEYLLSFNDGHITAINPLQLPPLSFVDDFTLGLSLKYASAGYGFSLVKLDNGNVVVTIINENSEAYKAGIRMGTVVTKWNNKPMQQAANEVSKVWSISRSADKDNMEQNNYMMLTRAKEGENANITYIDQSNKEQTLTLNADNWNYKIDTKDRDLFYHIGKKFI